MKWLGHRDLCPIQWGEECDCADTPDETAVGDSRHWSDGTPVDDAEMEANSRDEQRPDDDPAPAPTCDGRDCGGRPHE